MEFFKVYITVYECLIINRVINAKNCSNDELKINLLRTKILKVKDSERVLRNGLTNNSRLSIKIIHLDPSIKYKNYVLNVKIANEDIIKDIILLEENLGKATKM